MGCAERIWRISKPCGDGEQTRKVACVLKGEPVSVEKCSSSGDKPEAARPCNKGECPVWKPGEYGECSKECNGVQTRSIVCTLAGEPLSDGKKCDEAGSIKPAQSRPCSKASCNSQAIWGEVDVQVCPPACTKKSLYACWGEAVEEDKCSGNRPDVYCSEEDCLKVAPQLTLIVQRGIQRMGRGAVYSGKSHKGRK